MLLSPHLLSIKVRAYRGLKKVTITTNIFLHCLKDFKVLSHSVFHLIFPTTLWNSLFYTHFTDRSSWHLSNWKRLHHSKSVLNQSKPLPSSKAPNSGCSGEGARGNFCSWDGNPSQVACKTGIVTLMLPQETCFWFHRKARKNQKIWNT